MSTEQNADSLSGIPGIAYLYLAIQAASRLKTPNVIIPVDVANQLMNEVAKSLGIPVPPPVDPPPTMDVTRLTPTEVSARVRSVGSRNPFRTSRDAVLGLSLEG